MQVKITTEKDQLTEEIQNLHEELTVLKRDVKEILETIKPENKIELDYSYYEPPNTDETVDK